MAPNKLDGAVLKIAGVVVLGAIMSILDITVVSVALPTFQTEFNATYAQVAWTMTGYTLALATVIPLSGWAADRFGTKRLYMLALLLFTLGSVLCATADSISELIAYRVLQGLGGGMLMPLGMTIMTRAAGPERIGRLMAVLGIPMLLGPIGGPILGGWLIDAIGWHWIFLINLPIGAIALTYASFALPKDKAEPSQSFDFLGMLMLSPGLALFLYGISSLPETGTITDDQGLVHDAGRRCPGHRLRPVLVPAQAPAARPAAVPQPQPDGRRRSRCSCSSSRSWAPACCSRSYFLQVGGESHAERRPADGPAGHRRDAHHADRRHAGRQGPGRAGPSRSRWPSSPPGSSPSPRSADTSYVLLCGSLFVMGLGMGGTMMPIMTSALRRSATTRPPAAPRWSTSSSRSAARSAPR